ncbi:MAG TPA: hypothetical protein VGK01_19205 [Candidatus Angelobacter sp.]|jgi:hypothetical protein
MSTFGEDLLHYAETAHAVSLQDYISVLELIQNHLDSNLYALFFAIVVHQVVRHQGHLVSEFPTDPLWWDEIVTQDGSYKGQTALAYSLAKPVWIVGKERADLDLAESYLDLLGNAAPNTIPKYARIGDVAHAKTSIILPLSLGYQPFGVMNVESKLYLRASGAVLQELARMARAIALLRHTKETTDLRSKRTSAARVRLVKNMSGPILGNQQLFLASSSIATDEVMGAIKVVLNNFEASFDLVEWTNPGSGDIHKTIWKGISNSGFALCYLSEPDEAGRNKYRDNPNVLIEAGMLFALRESKQSPMHNFLLVRESDSPKTPFDIHSEYMVIVPRFASGKLNVELFRDLLHQHISAMLNAVQPEPYTAENI